MTFHLQFHHIGVPVEKSALSENARFSPLFRMYSEEKENLLGIKIEYHAFEPDSSLDIRLQTRPHIAFKTDDIESALKNQEIVMPLYEPFKGYRCAAIELNGVLIELLETQFSEKQLWNEESILKNGILYGTKTE